jgi:hypothetical protein
VPTLITASVRRTCAHIELCHKNGFLTGLSSAHPILSIFTFHTVIVLEIK